MDLPDIIIVAIIGLIVGGAVAYIIRAKMKGNKCIGCPYSSTCAKSCSCSCHSDNTGNE